MNKNNTVLIAVVGIGAILIILMMRQKQAVAAQTSYSVNLGGALSALGGLIHGSSGKVAPQGYDPLGGTGGKVDTAAQQSYAISHDVVEQQGNVLVDQNTGNALSYDVPTQ